jgi:energy-coupling factor transport system ATP-binding protein
MNTAALLTVHELSFRYPDHGTAQGRAVLDRLSLSVPAGRMTVLLGPADAGKTTLARILAGLVPRFSGGRLSGRIELEGKDIVGVRPWELMDRVGVIAQDSDQQILTTRCDTEVAFALESLGLPRDRIRTKVGESLAAMGLSDFASRSPVTLSGGEKKRLLLACLAAIGPDLWILDESLAELDRSWRVTVLDILRNEGRTVLALDSRWSELLAERGGTFAIMAEGSIAAASNSPHEPEFVGSLAGHGIIGRGRPAGLRRGGSAPFLRAENLRFHFPRSEGFELCVDSLDLAQGEIAALIGSNGCGKSTLGKILCGLHAPVEGRVSLMVGDGFRPAAPETLNGSVGYLFQNPDHQIYLPTVRDELALGLRLQGVARTEIGRRVEEAVELFSLPDLSAPPALMSYGGRRRLQAATYYLLSRGLLVLDEIDAGLSTREVQQLLEALFSRRPGIVLITHDLVLATSTCARILVMEEGRLVGDYRPEEYDRLDRARGTEGGR